MDELLAHLIGDYLTQTSWEASQKTKRALPAMVHAAKYTACFLPITRNPRALAVIGGTHYVIDRYRLVQYVNWLKNQIAVPVGYVYDMQDTWPPTGYAARGKSFTPEWLAVTLMIVSDNTMHLTINRLTLRRWP